MRRSHGTIGTKIVAALDLLPPPIRSNPLTTRMFSIAGFFATDSRSASVLRAVRSSVAPSGSTTAEMMKPWSSGGTKLVGTRVSSQPVPAAIATNRSSAISRCRSARFTAPR